MKLSKEQFMQIIGETDEKRVDDLLLLDGNEVLVKDGDYTEVMKAWYKELQISMDLYMTKYLELRNGAPEINRIPSNTQTYTYSMGWGWFMDIVYFPIRNYAEAWIYDKDHGVKSLMYGQDLTNGEMLTLAGFAFLAASVFDDYKNGYNDDLYTLELAAEIKFHYDR